MKSYNHLFEKVISHDNLSMAIDRSARGKRKRRDVSYCLAHKEEVIAKVQSILLMDDYRPPKHKPKEINDGITRKKRKIVVPKYMYEQIVHHAIVQVIAPIIQKSSYTYSCGSMPERGIIYGKRYLERFIRERPKDCKYVLKMDIRHYFQSVNHDILIALVRKTFHDERLCRLIEKIIRGYSDHEGHGIPIGFYTSQWFANWYLQGLDYYIKQTLGASCYVRYMDDLVILGRNKKRLHRMKNEIEAYLRDTLELAINDNWQVFRIDSRPLDFLGFRFYRTRTTLRRSIMLKATRKARRMARLTWYNAAQMVSYLGWFMQCNAYGIYWTWIKPYVSKRILRKKLRRRSYEISLA